MTDVNMKEDTPAEDVKPSVSGEQQNGTDVVMAAGTPDESGNTKKEDTPKEKRGFDSAPTRPLSPSKAASKDNLRKR